MLYICTEQKTKYMKFTEEALLHVLQGLRLQADESHSKITHYNPAIRDIYVEKQKRIYSLWERIERNGTQEISLMEDEIKYLTIGIDILIKECEDNFKHPDVDVKREYVWTSEKLYAIKNQLNEE